MALVDATFNEKDELTFEVSLGSPGGSPRAVSYDGDNIKAEIATPGGGNTYSRSRVVNT